jgi:predicted dehydrogenase
MSDGKLKFGLIGTGAIAQSYFAAFKQTELAELVGVADVNEAAAQAVADEMGCSAHTDFEALAKAHDLDAVIICTPPITHPDITCYMLEHDVHVLCEKPMSIDVASAERMAATAHDTGKLLTMASKFRYVEDVQKARQLMADGVIGDVVLFENAFTARVDMSERWNSKKEISGGGVLIDNGTHSLDIMRFFLGPLNDVQVIEGLRSKNMDVDETVRIFARSESGVLGSIDLSWSINKELASFINIYGTKGTIFVGWGESKYKCNGDDWTVFGSGYNKVKAFQNQIENFSRAIRGEEDLLIKAEDGVASVAAVEAAYKALDQNPWVSVDNGAAVAVG